MARVKKKSYENLTAQNIEKVISLLNPDTSAQPTGESKATPKAITKKEACEILNISYNTTRLNAIIEGHLEQKAYVKKRKSQNRGRPASDAEISEAVTDYLSGANVTDISKRLFRSVGFVRAILEGVGVPQRPTGEERKAIDYFPDECVSEDFAEGEIAWSAIYHSAVKVGKRMTKEYQDSKQGLSTVDYESKYATPAYQIYVVQKVDSEDTFFSSVTQGGFSAYSTAYDLGKLEHLKKYGVDLNRL